MSGPEVTLLPCPFCGGSDLDTQFQNTVICNKCQAIGPEIYIGSMSNEVAPKNRAEAIAAWNTRQSATAPLEAQIAALNERNDALALQADEWEGKYTIASDMIAALEAQCEALAGALQRCEKIVRDNLHRQNEKVEDVVLIARAALAQHKGEKQ